MKRNIFTNLRLFAFAPLVLIILTHCSTTEFLTLGLSEKEKSISLAYNHFEGGVLFQDIEFGLDVLWEASFKNGRAYKENLGYFVPTGLLILPNKDNTPVSSRLTALRNTVIDNQLFVLFEGNYLQVLGIVHTHPEVHSVRMPAPRFDYQFGYLGIHNYIMSHHDLFDAYKEANGDETYDLLGPRDAYYKIPLTVLKYPINAAVATVQTN